MTRLDGPGTALDHETGVPRWREPRLHIVARRLVTLPGLLLSTALVTATLPLSLLVAAVHDLVRKRDWISVRCVVVLVANLWAHIVGVLGLSGIWLLAGRWSGASPQRAARWTLGFEIWWARLVFGVAKRVFRMTMRVEGTEHAAPGPIILFPRHASILDVLLPVLHVAAPHRMHLRFAIKRELLWDPAVDIFGHREPSAFVRRGTQEHAPEIAAVRHLMDGLSEHDSVVVFAEGTRFTPQKQQRVLASLRRKDPAWADRAAALRNLLPPRLGGALAVLDANERADVVFFAHTGLEGANHLADLFAGSLLHTAIRGQMWRVPRQDIPGDTDARIDWLYGWWQRIDRWIDEHRNGTATTTASADREAAPKMRLRSPPQSAKRST